MPIKSPSLLRLIAIQLWAIPTALCLSSAIESESVAINESPAPRPIVVGVDGSKAAIRAALWGVDEAVSRDVPLCLLYAIEHGGAQEANQEAMARKLATAEIAVRRARTTVSISRSSSDLSAVRYCRTSTARCSSSIANICEIGRL